MLRGKIVPCSGRFASWMGRESSGIGLGKGLEPTPAGTCWLCFWPGQQAGSLSGLIAREADAAYAEIFPFPPNRFLKTIRLFWPRWVSAAARRPLSSFWPVESLVAAFAPLSVGTWHLLP